MNRRLEIFRFGLMVFLGFSGLCTLNSYLALHFRDIGFSNAQIGVLYSVFYFLGGFSIPLFNPLVQDTRRLQKLMPFYYCIGSIVVLAILTLTSSYTLAIIAMVIFSLAKGTGFPMFESCIMLFTESKDMEYARIRQLGSLAFVLFNLIGGNIADHFGFGWIFILGIIFYSICGLISTRTQVKIEDCVKEDVISEKDSKQSGSVKALLTNKKFLLFLFGQLFLGSLYIATEGFSALYYDFRGISVTNIGFMASAVVAVELVTMIFLTKALNKLHGAFGQIIVGLCMLLRCVCYALGAPIWVVYAMVAVAGVQSGVNICIVMRYIKNIIGLNNIGSGFMLNTMMILLMSGLVNISSGFIVDNFSFTTLYITLGVIVTIGMIGVLLGYLAIYKRKMIEE